MTKRPAATREITVGKIAKRIQEADEDIASVINRIRSWTKEGVLKPIDDKAPGTGQKLRYPERAVVDAAILSQIAEHYGLWANKMAAGVTDALDLTVRQLVKSKYVTEQGQIIYLFIWAEGTGAKRRIKSNVQWIDDPELSRRPKDGLPKRSIEMPESDDGLWINLTRLFSRLGVPFKDYEELEEFFKMFPQARRIGRA
jgi:hypothetical protein